MKNIFLIICVVLSTESHAQPNYLMRAKETIIKNSYFNFLTNYLKNEKKLESFKILKYTGSEFEPPYRIDFTEAEKYFIALRKLVPDVGESYIEKEKADYKRCDSIFKIDTTSDSPEGFDYVRWTGSQENSIDMVKMFTSKKNKYLVVINKEKALLEINVAYEKGFDLYYVPFKKEKNKWKVAGNISPLMPD